MDTYTRPNERPAFDAVVLLGRALIAYLFVPGGFGKLIHFSSTVGLIGSKGVPIPELAAAAAIGCELGLGLLLLFGWQTRWAALGLAIFVAVITPIFHGFWYAPDAARAMQKINFDKNLAVVGGLLVLATVGAGRWSIDREPVAGPPEDSGARRQRAHA
jgi:putative oxidoreductase